MARSASGDQERGAPPTPPSPRHQPADPCNKVTSKPFSARRRSRVWRTHRIGWLGERDLGALSAPAVTGWFGLSEPKSTWHRRRPHAQKRRFRRQSKLLAFVDGN